VIAKHISAPIPKLSEREPETPAALVRLGERMLAKDPAGRPTAAELVKELSAASTPDALLDTVAGSTATLESVARST
jgi:hypothetical protein